MVGCLPSTEQTQLLINHKQLIGEGHRAVPAGPEPQIFVITQTTVKGKKEKLWLSSGIFGAEISTISA